LCWQVRWELARARIYILADFIEVLRRRRMMGQELSLSCDQQQRRRYGAPFGPNLVLNLPCHSIKLPDTNYVVIWELLSDRIVLRDRHKQKKPSQVSHATFDV
jgi:hypothetical protein